MIAPGMSRDRVLAVFRRAFAAAGIDTAALDARLLLLHALKIDAPDLLRDPDQPITVDEAERSSGALSRRLAGEPVGRILGTREFWGLPFALSPDTLEPRPDTETLVEAALEALADRRGEPLRILDLGTGSGCLLVALLHEFRQASGIGIDASQGALGTARGNAIANGVGERAAFIAGDWGTALDERFDLIVSNPPYIPAGDIASLTTEVREHDPRLALDGGDDGFNAYRRIIADLPRLLTPGGLAVLEAGIGQAGGIADLMRGAGLTVLTRRDLGGVERAILGFASR